MAFDQQKRQQIADALQQRNATNLCSRCNHPNHTLAHDGYVMLPLNDNPANGNVVIPPPSIPCIATVCNNCGHISHHAAAVLGV